MELVKKCALSGQMFFQSSLKKQMLLAGCFVLGYFSPLAGLLLLLVAHVRKWDKAYGKYALFGGGIALSLYLIGYYMTYL